ncbi:MAG: sugar transferase [Acidobacteria bacterium]|nr:sugar transferase [Acidobacteriota bacterium]
MKRTCDIIGALLGMILLAPLWVSVAAAIILTSGRPAVFKQVRSGKAGKPFFIRKFRTMAILLGTEKGIFEPGNRRRITAFGRFLRRTKLDELPQLWNVLVGDMSFVGPRPEVPEWVAVNRDRWEKVLSVRPGMTDPASIVFRNEETMLAASSDPRVVYRDRILPQKLALYEDYIRTRTPTKDILIFIRTLVRVFVDVPGGKC